MKESTPSALARASLPVVRVTQFTILNLKCCVVLRSTCPRPLLLSLMRIDYSSCTTAVLFVCLLYTNMSKHLALFSPAAAVSR